MPVTRTYACDDCEYQWNVFHMRSDEPVPECPQCSAVDISKIPGLFSINGVAARAGDFVQKMAEEDYGMTNMRDNLREGDIAAVAPPPIQTAEAEQITMAMKELIPVVNEQQAQQAAHFWQPASSNAPAQVTALASPGAAEARNLGSDPVELLHKAEKAASGRAGRSGPKLEVVGRAKMSDG